MKKIVPFNNVLTFSTDVREITAISLEHNIKKESDLVTGEFYISGEYKITDGQLEREKFNFELPFDIALSSNYVLDTLVVDIDDFRYELIDAKKLKVNIDLYLDGEVEEIKDPEPVERIIEEPLEELRTENDLEEDIDEESIPINEDLCEEDLSEETIEEKEETIDNFDIYEETSSSPIERKIDLLEEMLTNDKENTMSGDTTNININENNEINIFGSFNEEEKFVTYRVYRVMEGDTIDKILEKYNISKSTLEQYNNIEDIKPGDKLIIPTDDK